MRGREEAAPWILKSCETTRRSAVAVVMGGGGDVMHEHGDCSFIRVPEMAQHQATDAQSTNTKHVPGKRRMLTLTCIALTSGKIARQRSPANTKLNMRNAVPMD